MSLDQALDWFVGEPLPAAVTRITRRLTVDGAALRLLRRAADRGGAEPTRAYAWALGEALAAGVNVNPLAVADAADEAVEWSPEAPVVLFGAGLAHAGAFGGRRSLPLSARRGFANAARHDPDNLLPHLALAAARDSTGDLAAADRSLADALAAPRCTPYESPLAGPLRVEAPWLSEPLATLWPGRVTGLVRFVVGRALTRAERDGDLARCRALVALGLRFVTGAAQPRWLTLGAGVASQALGCWARLVGGEPVEPLRAGLRAALDTFLSAQREVAREFEREAEHTLRLAGAGSGAGAALTVLGWLKSRRRWPVPIPLATSLAIPGRVIAAGGLVLSVGSALVALADNPAARARRQVAERHALAAEQALVARTAEQVSALLAPFVAAGDAARQPVAPAPVAPAPDPA